MIKTENRTYFDTGKPYVLIEFNQNEFIRCDEDYTRYTIKNEWLDFRRFYL